MLHVTAALIEPLTEAEKPQVPPCLIPTELGNIVTEVFIGAAIGELGELEDAGGTGVVPPQPARKNKKETPAVQIFSTVIAALLQEQTVHNLE